MRKGLILILMLGLALQAEAKEYLTVEQAQQLMFSGRAMTRAPQTLSSEQQSKMTDASSVKFPFDGKNVWKVADGGWFVVDQVVGKHEFITYAVGINADGTVKQVDVLEYNESYGYEVRERSWMNQFVGKTASMPIKLNQDIKNISGATLSSKHLSDGVKRVMVMYELVLKGQK
jgi:Na+-translocating ferredoxin:NAD+ oxidoreductase RnfG subunit